MAGADLPAGAWAEARPGMAKANTAKAETTLIFMTVSFGLDLVARRCPFTLSGPVIRQDLDPTFHRPNPDISPTVAVGCRF
jgi:hypothetical protein